jgi:hypothetical protein
MKKMFPETYVQLTALCAMILERARMSAIGDSALTIAFLPGKITAARAKRVLALCLSREIGW